MFKIFGIGDNKTGTTSLGKALNILGFGPVAEFPQSYHLIANYKNSIYDILKPSLLYASKFGNFNDFPWNLLDFYKYYDKQFPNSKFILTFRTPEKWFDSVLHFCTPPNGEPNCLYNIERMFKAKQPEFILLFDKLLKEKHHINELYDMKKNKSNFIDTYNKRNEEVVNFFSKRSSDFFVVDWEEPGNNWEKLCNFLKVPLPNKMFPHLMKRKLK